MFLIFTSNFFVSLLKSIVFKNNIKIKCWTKNDENVKNDDNGLKDFVIFFIEYIVSR